MEKKRFFFFFFFFGGWGEVVAFSCGVGEGSVCFVRLFIT